MALPYHSAPSWLLELERLDARTNPVVASRIFSRVFKTAGTVRPESGSFSASASGLPEAEGEAEGDSVETRTAPEAFAAGAALAAFAHFAAGEEVFGGSVEAASSTAGERIAASEQAGIHGATAERNAAVPIRAAAERAARKRGSSRRGLAGARIERSLPSKCEGRAEATAGATGWTAQWTVRKIPSRWPA